MTGIKDQKFGIELEMTGLTREKAAKVLRNALEANGCGPAAFYRHGGAYDAWHVTDGRGRTWKLVRDSSIAIEGGEAVELVTPVLGWADIPLLQACIRALRKAGARVNETCGLHIHVDASPHTAQTLQNLIRIWAAKEQLIFQALRVPATRRDRYCKPIEARVRDGARSRKLKDMADLHQLWYGVDAWNRPQANHYHHTRYHALNLHSVWFRGTIEFRCFNATLHAGEVKAYIQFCLAVSAQALRQKTAGRQDTETTNPKYTFRCWLLRLGMIGDEFETARLHLLKHLPGNAAWRYGAAR